MPRKYVLVSSSSSSTSLDSFGCSPDSNSADRRRHRRSRTRRGSPRPEPRESLHWWLARWLSSEFAKIAGAFYESGKGCVRYLSNTALQALPSVHASREIQEEPSGTSRSRGSRSNRNLSPYTVAGESLEVAKSRRSHRKSAHGRRDRHSSPHDTPYVSLKHSRHEHGRSKSKYPAPKQGSRRSHHRDRFCDNWIHEKNWIENLLKEVKSNFKSPVKVKVYKVSAGEGPSRPEHSTGSDASMTSKLSISIEELFSPTYPSGHSELVSSSGGGKSSETTALQSDTSVAKTRGAGNKAESSKRRPNESAKSAKPATGALEKLPTPTYPHQDSQLRLSVADFHELSVQEFDGKASTPKNIDGTDGVPMPFKDKVPTPKSKTDAADPKVPYNSVHEQSTLQPKTAVPTAPHQTFDFHKLRHGDVFYKKCTVFCEDVAAMAQGNGNEQQSSDIVYETPDLRQAPGTPCDCPPNSGAPNDQSKQGDTGPAMQAKNPPSLRLLERDLNNAASSNATTQVQQNGVIVYETPGLSPSTSSLKDSGASDDQSKVAGPMEQTKKTPGTRALTSGPMNTTPNKDTDHELPIQNIKNTQHAVTVETIDSTFTEERSITVSGSSGAQVFASPSLMASSRKVGVEVRQNKVENPPVAQPFSGSRSSASAKTRDPASLLAVRPQKGEPTNPDNVEIRGASLLTPTLPGQERLEAAKTPSPRESSHKGVPKDSNSKISLASRTKIQSNSSTKVLLVKSGEKVISSQKMQTHSSKTAIAARSTDRYKTFPKTHMHGIYDKGHPDMLKSTSSELMEIIIDSSSLQSLDGTFPTVEIEKSAAVSISTHKVTRKQNDEALFIVSDETNAAQYLNAPSSVMNKIQGARGILDNVTGASSWEPVTTSSKGAILSRNNYGFGSEKELASVVNSTNYTASKERNGLPRAREEGVPSVTSLPKGSAKSTPMTASNALEMGSTGGLVEPSNQTSAEAEAMPTEWQSDDSTHKAYGLAKRYYHSSPQYATSVMAGDPEELLLEVESSSFEKLRSDVDQSALPGTPSFGDEHDSDPRISAPNAHLTFGQEEKISFSIAVTSETAPYEERPAERFKLPVRLSTITQKLSPIREEEPDVVGQCSPSSSILQQRRNSMVTPGLLKRKSRMSTYSIEAATTPAAAEESDVSCTPYKGSTRVTDRCPCKKICDCCTCGIAGSSVAHPLSKDLPSDVGAGDKSAFKQQSRIGAVDMSSKPFPKNSFDVLRSPFYAHWDYYDLDQDHPIARFVRRPEHAEFDPTDTILMKNVRVGGYLIPYLKVSTKEKVTSKMVCNFYKSRKLPLQGKGVSQRPDSMDGTNLDLEHSSSEELVGQKKKKCRCQETREEENVWKDYSPVEQSTDLLDFPTELIFEDKSKCSQTEEGCMCVGKPEYARKIPVPGTPCESCDCFISDVELESRPIGVRSSYTPAYAYSEPSIDRTAVVNEYICTLQELCSNLCTMIGKIRVVIDETSPSGRYSPTKSTNPSLETDK